MYDYSRLPTLVPVMDRILGYLSVKERVRCKGLCRSWREEIELREPKSDTLVLHTGPYPWNMHWTQTNNRRLMKFENSFQMKNISILDHPMTRALLEKTKKLAIVQLSRNDFVDSNFEPYLGHFKHCIEEIEIRNFRLQGTLKFDLPKLKVLVINNCPADKFVLNCRSLEVLFWSRKVNEIRFQNAKKLKRLICFGWPATVSLNGKFDALEYLYVLADEPVNNRLLDRMPKLKRLVLYHDDEMKMADLEIIREQQKRLGLKNLEVLFNAFRDPVEVAFSHSDGYEDRWVQNLFENYSKLVENSPWSIDIDYSKLFSKFKILPSNFFERFNEFALIEISAVTSYSHLFGFLKSCPYVQTLKLHFSKVDTNLILGLMQALQPTLVRLVIVEERPQDVLKFVLSFIRIFELTILSVDSPRLSIDFLRKVAARKGPRLVGVTFRDSTTGHELGIYFKPQGGILLIDISCRERIDEPSLDRLITGMQNDPHLSTFLL